jgi:hypothetical protein
MKFMATPIAGEEIASTRLRGQPLGHYLKTALSIWNSAIRMERVRRESPHIIAQKVRRTAKTNGEHRCSPFAIKALPRFYPTNSPLIQFRSVFPWWASGFISVRP